MKENLEKDILDKSMWNMYQTMKDDNFQFDGYSNDDKIMMINHILPYFEKIEEYEICKELNQNQEINTTVDIQLLAIVNQK